MRRAHALVAAALAALAAPAFAAPPLFLTPADIDPMAMIPPPPADGSPAALAEVAELHRIQDARTPAQLAQAESDDRNETVWVFADVIGPGFAPAALPATARLFADVRQDGAWAAKRAKAAFHRTRPWAADPTLVGCPHPGEGDVKTSYPSGHTTFGYSSGIVLAALVPEKAPAIMARVGQYGENRLVCGHHFRRDIEAGQELGAVVAVDLMHVAAFQAEFAAARAEMQRAGLAAASTSAASR